MRRPAAALRVHPGERRRDLTPRIENQERRFLSVDEIHDLADNIDGRYRLLVLLGGNTGLRFGELAALRVSNFGVGLQTLTVTETLTTSAESYASAHRRPGRVCGR